MDSLEIKTVFSTNNYAIKGNKLIHTFTNFHRSERFEYPINRFQYIDKTNNAKGHIIFLILFVYFLFASIAQFYNPFDIGYVIFIYCLGMSAVCFYKYFLEIETRYILVFKGQTSNVIEHCSVPGKQGYEDLILKFSDTIEGIANQNFAFLCLRLDENLSYNSHIGNLQTLLELKEISQTEFDIHLEKIETFFKNI